MDEKIYAEVLCSRCLGKHVERQPVLALLDRTVCVSCGSTGDKLIAVKSPWGTLKVWGEE